MNILVAETETNKGVGDFITSLKEGSKKQVNLISNPIESNIHCFKKNKKQYVILGVDIKVFPVYYLFFMFLFLFFIYPGIWFAIPVVIFGLFSVPFTTLFWQLLYRYGIKKKGYKGKVKFLQKDKALKVLLWDK